MKSITFFILFCMSLSAIAVTPTPDVSILSTVTASIGGAATDILPQAILWLSSLMALQFVITNFGLLKSGAEIEVVFAKFIGLIAWFAVCFYILNNGPDFIDAVGTGLLQKFAANIPSPGSIITATLALCTSLLIAIGILGTSIVGIGNSSLAMVLVYVLFIIFSIGMYMSIKIFMLSLELALTVMLSPLSFSFLGMNALKDQGIAPFKSLISLAYRIILLGIIFTAFSKVMDVGAAALNGIQWSNPLNYGKGLNIIFSTLTAFPFLAYLVYKSDSIAASLANGSTNMGPGDIAGAAAAGAAAGAAAASGGASAAAGAGKAGQSMGDFMKGLPGGGGGLVSNASSSGVGPAPVGPPPQSPSMSMGAGGLTAGNKAPRRDDYPDPANKTQLGGPHPTNSPKPPSSSGHEANAGIGAPSSSPGQQGGDPDRGLNQAKQGKGFKDHLSELNHHVAQEKASTGVSISTHHSD